MLIIVLFVIGILLFLIFRNIKILKLSSVNLFTGELGTGKSALSLNRALITYKCNLIKFTLIYIFDNSSYIFKNYELLKWEDKPLFYSNIPLLNTQYCELTKNILLRKVRIPNKSVIFIDEISLVVDNMDFKDQEINYNLKMFIKLFRHYSHGGSLFINTQNIQDNHYIIKRVINKYFYIHSKIRLPFISILKVREFLYSEDNSNINTINTDLETDLKTVIIFNKIFKKYDSICYSILTDNLQFYKKLVEKIKSRKDLKTTKILNMKGEKYNEKN